MFGFLFAAKETTLARLQNTRTPPMTQPRFLTGITTTGTPHLGNYVGAIRPAIDASQRDDVDSFFFLADYHALVKCGDPERVSQSTLSIAASWLAAGLDPERVVFYRQSDVPEIPELMWMLTCMAGKGLLNRAHAYKAAVDKNTEAGEDPDAGVNTGLYLYPVLMAADILAFSATHVPVGKDQIQHIEMARDFAARFNHLYGDGGEGGGALVLPEAVVDTESAVLPGTDGRKMSKSYDNVVPLFGTEATLRKAVFSMLTDSKGPDEAKSPDDSGLFALYRAFSSLAQTAEFAFSLERGMSWGDAKQAVFARLNEVLSPMRARYDELMDNPQRIEDILLAGAEKARAEAAPMLADVRRRVGIRPLTAVSSSNESAVAPKAVAKPIVKQFREPDGSFRFRLAEASGTSLLLSPSFASPKECGQTVAKLKSFEGYTVTVEDKHVMMGGQQIGTLDEGVSPEQCLHAIELLRQPEEEHS